MSKKMRMACVRGIASIALAVLLVLAGYTCGRAQTSSVSGASQPTVLYGVAYYHEYMPYERLDKDVAMMKEAAISVVRMGGNRRGACGSILSGAPLELALAPTTCRLPGPQATMQRQLSDLAQRMRYIHESHLFAPCFRVQVRSTLTVTKMAETAFG